MSAVVKAVLGLAAAVAVWITAFSIDWESTKTTRLGPSLELREALHTDRRAYFGMAESGRSIWLPFPTSSEYMTRQGLYRGGLLVWQGDPFHGGRMTFHASPDEKHVVLEPALQDQPWTILDLDAGRSVEVPDPAEDVSGHDYMWPLVFARWSDDSRIVFAVVEGSAITPDREMVSYRKVFEVDPATGVSRFLRQCLDPRVRPLSWEGTECGPDSFRNEQQP